MARGFTRMMVRRLAPAAGRTVVKGLRGISTVSHLDELPPISLRAAVSELVAMTLFVYIGCGTATTFSSRSNGTAGFERGDLTDQILSNNNTENFLLLNDRLQINSSWGIITALAFGLAITAICFATAHLSGGQLNPAVTVALAVVGALPPIQAAANVAAQVLGSILGAAFLAATLPSSTRQTLGSNELAPGVSTGNALCGEIIMSFLLVSVVLETAVNVKSASRAQAPLAIGFAVFCAHAVLLPIDGCSINPARSLGPAIVSTTWPDSFWVFVVGPFVGALAAVPFHLFFRSDFDTLPAVDPVDLRASATSAEAETVLRRSTTGAAGAAPQSRKTSQVAGSVAVIASSAGEAEAMV